MALQTGGANLETLKSLLVEAESSFPNTQTVLKRKGIWSRAPTRPKTKNDCAGEGQQ
jgi:hypothetical protein